jgi:hypothetical protein
VRSRAYSWNRGGHCGLVWWSVRHALVRCGFFGVGVSVFWELGFCGAARGAMGGGAGESEDLPQANVKRVVKSKLQELALGHYGEERDVAVNKDALLAFSESAKIFIHFLSATYVLLRLPCISCRGPRMRDLMFLRI